MVDCTFYKRNLEHVDAFQFPTTSEREAGEPSGHYRHQYGSHYGLRWADLSAHLQKRILVQEPPTRLNNVKAPDIPFLTLVRTGLNIVPTKSS